MYYAGVDCAVWAPSKGVGVSPIRKEERQVAYCPPAVFVAPIHEANSSLCMPRSLSIYTVWHGATEELSREVHPPPKAILDSAGLVLG